MADGGPIGGEWSHWQAHWLWAGPMAGDRTRRLMGREARPLPSSPLERGVVSRNTPGRMVGCPEVCIAAGEARSSSGSRGKSRAHLESRWMVPSAEGGPRWLVAGRDGGGPIASGRPGIVRAMTWVAVRDAGKSSASRICWARLARRGREGSRATLAGSGVEASRRTTSRLGRSAAARDVRDSGGWVQVEGGRNPSWPQRAEGREGGRLSRPCRLPAGTSGSRVGLERERWPRVMASGRTP
jgi:hypothetical protein